MKSIRHSLLADKKVVFLDLDGTMYLGDNLIPGAREFLDALAEHGIAAYFLSNNSSRSKQDYVKKLARLGITSSEDRIILSTDGVIAYLHARNTRQVYIVGTRSMRDMFAQAGITGDSSHPDFVVLGFDTELTYDKLKTAALHMQAGVELLATHPDYVCPTPEGPIPDVGAMLALLEKSTGRKPLKIFGKPHPDMVRHILERHEAGPEQAAVIGDRIYTDMELARRLGCAFILVLSGETSSADLDRLPGTPDMVATTIGHILRRD